VTGPEERGRGGDPWARVRLPGTADPPAAPNVDVLVVDDDFGIRITWAAILRGAGYTVAVAEDGEVALRTLQGLDAGLVLLDLRMPRRDGFSVLDAMGERQLVVLVSAYALDEAMWARTGARVVTYLEKPIMPDRLIDVVARTLAASRSAS